MSECFDLELKDGVAHLRMCRPEAMNSMTPAFWRELPALVNGLSDAGEARVIVLSSTGKHFTAGMDLAVFQGGGLALGGKQEEPGRARTRTRDAALLFQESFNALEKARVPVLAAIQGGCVGGGVDMISACDVRYCTEDAFFCIQEINLGLTADVGTLQRLPKLVPAGVVRELAYTGRRLPAQRALEVGLVNEVYPSHEAMLAGVLATAAEIAEKSPLAIWGSKQMLNYARDHSVEDGLEYIATWQAGMFFGTDMAEAFQAKAEKRKPVFQNNPPTRREV
jgi:enoyl-CoA hydratase/carnithine racemase